MAVVAVVGIEIEIVIERGIVPEEIEIEMENVERTDG